MAHSRRNVLYEAVLILVVLFVVSLIPLELGNISRFFGYLFWKAEYGILRFATWLSDVKKCVYGGEVAVDYRPILSLPSVPRHAYAGAKLVAVRWTPGVREVQVLTSTEIPQGLDAMLVLPSRDGFVVVGKVLSGGGIHYWVRLIWDVHFRVPASTGGIIGWFERGKDGFYFVPIASPINPIPAETKVVWLGNPDALLGVISATITSANPVPVNGFVSQLLDVPMAILVEGGYR